MCGSDMRHAPGDYRIIYHNNNGFDSFDMCSVGAGDSVAVCVGLMLNWRVARWKCSTKILIGVRTIFRAVIERRCQWCQEQNNIRTLQVPNGRQKVGGIADTKTGFICPILSFCCVHRRVKGAATERKLSALVTTSYFRVYLSSVSFCASSSLLLPLLSISKLRQDDVKTTKHRQIILTRAQPAAICWEALGFKTLGDMKSAPCLE